MTKTRGIETGTRDRAILKIRLQAIVGFSGVLIIFMQVRVPGEPYGLLLESV